MTTPRKRTNPAVIELLMAADNALAAAEALTQKAHTTRHEAHAIIEKVSDVDWIKRYPETVAKAFDKLHSIEERAGRLEAEAETQVAHARRFVMAAQFFDRE